MLRKRVMDLLLTIPGLILISPLLLIICFWIKLDSRGPILFKHTRVGRHGAPLKVYKFRTMAPDARSRGMELTTKDDGRVTRAGRFLRHYKLDELPQLFNVLKGDMSLVGPRPEVPKYVDCYPEPVKDLVLSVKPGITDEASIDFRDESDLLDASADPERTYIEHILPIKLHYYTDYVAAHSLRGDLGIILRTLGVILPRSGSRERTQGLGPIRSSPLSTQHRP